jgi:hypothetical protein
MGFKFMILFNKSMTISHSVSQSVSSGTANLPRVLSHHPASKGVPVFFGAPFLIHLVHPVKLSNSGPSGPSAQSLESAESAV